MLVCAGAGVCIAIGGNLLCAVAQYCEQLLTTLQARVQKWSSSQCLGDIFIRLSDFMKVYTQYIKEYPPCSQKITSLSKADAEFERFIKVRIASICSHPPTLRDSHSKMREKRASASELVILTATLASQSLEEEPVVAAAKLPFDSYLMQPVQRIPRYELLLRVRHLVAVALANAGTALTRSLTRSLATSER